RVPAHSGPYWTGPARRPYANAHRSRPDAIHGCWLARPTRRRQANRPAPDELHPADTAPPGGEPRMAHCRAAVHHDERQMTEPGHDQPMPEAPQATREPAPRQQEMPLALVLGQPVLQIPQDLYIPPDALEIILDAFEGPRDLLLYLIRRQNLDILDIPVAEISPPYVDYIQAMHEMRFELAAEYLVMAAILAEIKSRMLLPRPPSEEGLEDDPRADLVRRLQEYERFKQAAEDLDALPRQDRDTAPAAAFVPDRAAVRLPPPVDLREMLRALHDVLKRAELYTQHAIKRDALSVRQRMG